MNDRLTPKEIEDYGHEFLDVVGKKAREVSAGQIGGLQAQVQHLQGQLSAQARNAMKERLDAAVPNWRAINDDPAFTERLSQLNPASGRVLLDELRDAWASNDASRVAYFFREFGNGSAAAAYRGPTYQGRDGRFYRGTSGEPPVLTRREIELHYHNRMRGRVSDEDHKKFEARMEAAAKAGRISGGLDVDGK